MMHPYLTFADGTMVLHSDLKPDDNGGRVLAHNKGRIPTKDLRAIERIVATQHDMICREWMLYFDVGGRLVPRVERCSTHAGA